MTTTFETPWRERFTRTIDVAMTFVAMVAVVSLILEHGHFLAKDHVVILQAIDVGIIALFMLDMVAKLAIARRRLAYLRGHIVHYGLLALLSVGLLLAHRVHDFPAVGTFLTEINVPSVAKLYLVIIQIAIVLRLMIHAVEAQRQLAHTRFKPTHILVGSFVLIILIGTVLLWSPRAISDETKAREGIEHAGLIDALFTATSATCVTGLIVQDTGSYFSPFGQGVILVLIQIGGLGLMTFAAFFALIFGFGMRLKDRIVMQDVLDQHTLGEVGKLVISILAFTVIIEVIGAVLLYPAWTGEMSTGQRVYVSVFHSISCFCNAGFSLYRTSFMAYRGSVYLNVVVCLLIVLGGLGFVVHSNLFGVLRTMWRRVPLPFSRRKLAEPTGRIKLNLHTRVVLVTTLVLLLVGTLVVWALENSGQLAGLSTGEKVLASTFQSVTARTAGFNTLDTSKLSNGTLVFTALLMFIGASPGSTGGGIKTVTFAMLLIAVVSVLRNRRQFEVFHRSIPAMVIHRAVVVATVALLVVAVTTILLCHFEEARGVTLRDVFFESVSAFGTVGLSTGITSRLTSPSKITIILTMLIGRIGPLTLILALGQRLRRADYDYPAENLMIG